MENKVMKRGSTLKDRIKKYIMPLVLLALCVIFSLSTPAFLTPYNLMNILNQSAYVFVAGIGVAMVMLAGCMDLSIGYQISLGAVVAGLLMRDTGLPTAAVILLVLLLGFAMGMLNGVLVVKLKVFPMIITLATSYMFQGLSCIVSNVESIRGFSDAFIYIGQGKLFSFTIGGSIGTFTFGMLLALILLIFFSVVLNRTYFGRYIYGIGGNEEAMRLAGVNVDLVKMLIFGICGALVAVSTVMLSARTGSVSVNTGVGTEFTCLTAGILGGISFKGGEGKISGMVVGILIMNVLGNGMQLLGMSQYPQYIAKGIILTTAVGFETFQRMSRMRQKNKQDEKTALSIKESMGE